MTEPIYLKCTRSHFQKGKDLKFVCVMEACRQNSLCCQQCIKDSHEGHSTKQLKTLLSIGNYLKAKGPSNSPNSIKNTNCQNLLKIVEKNQSKTINSFMILRQTINDSLDKIQSNLENYFKELNETIKKPHSQQDPIKLLQSTLSEITSGKDYNQVVKSLQNFFLLLNKVGKDGHLQPIKNEQEVLEKMVSQSNKEIADLINVKLASMGKILTQSQQFIIKSTSSAQNLWEKPLYNFSHTLCHDLIKVQDSTKVISEGDGIYQTALMQPQINFNGSNQVIRFKIKKMTANWIAVGVGSKKIIEEKKFVFNPYDINHGAFMISANGGAWAHQTPQLNNRIRSFKFEQGDIITCIVDPSSKKIYFVKQSDISETMVNVKETFQLSFANFQSQSLHPCVTIHYLDNIVEYIPATNSSQIPKYDYLFSSTLKHSDMNVINNNSVMILDDGDVLDGYRACLLNKPVVDGNWNSTMNFSFRITNSSVDWVGVGICQKLIAQKKSYRFYFTQNNHGYYIISSNGGVWSSTDSSLNNKLGCWRFKTGDVIECEVELGEGPESTNNKIVFKKGKHNYILPFECDPDDKMYPCVMLHYVGDQVAIMPLF